MRRSLETLSILYKRPFNPTNWSISKQNERNQQCFRGRIWKKKSRMNTVDVLRLGKSETLPEMKSHRSHRTHFGNGFGSSPWESHWHKIEPCVKEKASVITMNNLYLYMETFGCFKETSCADVCWMSSFVCALAAFLNADLVLLI